ncbi:MAG: protein-L-isoaspartate O-methyltransferase [Pseudomonadota bacterium]
MEIEVARENMLRKQIREGFVTDEKIIDVFSKVPREQFVPEHYRECAFADMQIAIGNGQIMLTPNEEAKILQALNIKATDSILEIGTGTGYLTAVLANLGRRVDSIDYFESFVNLSKRKLSTMGIENVDIMQQDANQDFLHSSYDIIVMTSSVIKLAKKFLQHLNLGGRLFTIIGQVPAMKAMIFTHTKKGTWIEHCIFETVVPELINAPKPEAFVF